VKTYVLVRTNFTLIHPRGISNSPQVIIVMTNDQAEPPIHGDARESVDSIQQRNALRALLELPLLTAVRRLASEGDFDQSALRDELQAVCAVAKRNGVRAEQVLIAVKEIWSELPVERDAIRNPSGKPLMNKVVTMTLDEYYASRDSAS
jgi:hypothetical protein